ncbi:hypothetical protein [Christiangramia sediminis]|uniref:Uncharacterized protein n=1 Tax=Christiangramia sediminis TaxID=2881336 RepID=A0A9X1RX42_9FLAO|nr:hypothetical protein [Christiangramia sediminis]MCB7481236.1 hypothetical protein [Christiangramia sediminis]
MKKLLSYLFIFGFVFVASAQEINDYKYVIIPETFEFTGEVDEYRLNSLTKFLFEQNGFNTLIKTENKPNDLQQQGCLGLQTKLEDNSGLFVTKLILKLVDCNDQVVFETKEGRSREKDYQVAYQEALRDAFTSIEEIDYAYVEADLPKKAAETKTDAPPVAEEIEESEIVEEPEIYEDLNEEKGREEGIEVEELNKFDKQYQYSGKNYNLKETTQGLGLFQENSSDPIAILIETNKGESYIYNSLTNQGVAYFNEKGDLIVEYLNKQDSKKLTLIYKLRD